MIIIREVALFASFCVVMLFVMNFYLFFAVLLANGRLWAWGWVDAMYKNGFVWLFCGLW